MNALDRVDHLSELALDRFRFDPPESDPDFHAEALAHLDACAACRRAVERLTQEDASFGALERPKVKASTPRSRGEPRRFAPRRGHLAAVLALAAALVAVLTLGGVENQDGVRPAAPANTIADRGAEDRMGVSPFWEFAGTQWPARTGDVRRAGAVLGFRPTTLDGGFLLVAEVRDDGTHVPVWPIGGAAAAVDEQDALVELPASTGRQTVVAVFCRETFRFQDLRFAQAPTEEVTVDVAGQSSRCVTRVLSFRAPAPSRALPPSDEPPTQEPTVEPAKGRRDPPSTASAGDEQPRTCQKELGHCIAVGRPIRDCLAVRDVCVRGGTKVAPSALGASDEDDCVHAVRLCQRNGGDRVSCVLAASACQAVLPRAEFGNPVPRPATGTALRGGLAPVERPPCEAFLIGCVAATTSADQLGRCQLGYFACAQRAR